jgi:hypothetical protein
MYLIIFVEQQKNPLVNPPPNSEKMQTFKREYASTHILYSFTVRVRNFTFFNNFTILWI